MQKKSAVWLCLALVQMANAQERVYTTIDAQGRIQTIKSESATELKTVPKPVEQTNVVPKSATVIKNYEFEGEQYQDAEVLEQDTRNQKPKNRFYYVPSGALGEKVIESEGGVAVSTVSAIQPSPKSVIKVSPEYQVLSKEWLLTKRPDLQNYCHQIKQLKSARAFKNSNALWVEAVDFVANQPDKILSLEQVLTNSAMVRLASFANTHKKPKFYQPMVVFLNQQGCVLEGAWQYWSDAKPANDNQYSALEGLLTIPVDSKYVLFYPPNNELTIKLPLQNYGALLIEKY